MLREEAYEDGFEEGRECGLNNEQLRIARSLLDVLPDEMIAEKIGIDLDVVLQLRKEHEENK